MSNDCQAIRVRITGRVQGVSFRVWTRDEALKLGLVGWVRNESDGSVCALIAGPEDAILTMIERFSSGPPGASVVGVDVEPTTLTELPTGFHITR